MFGREWKPTTARALGPIEYLANDSRPQSMVVSVHDTLGDYSQGCYNHANQHAHHKQLEDVLNLLIQI